MSAPQPPSPRGSSSDYPTTPQQLEARHRRAILGIVLVTIGILFGVVQLALQVFETVEAVHAAKPVPVPSVIEIVHEFGFPVLLVIAGYALFSRSAAADLFAWVKSLLGKGV